MSVRGFDKLARGSIDDAINSLSIYNYPSNRENLISLSKDGLAGTLAAKRGDIFKN
jgi:hypothetical protein